MLLKWLTDLGRQSYLFRAFPSYIWAGTTPNAATPVSPNPVAVSQKLETIIR
jgi:hypothetical protein